jgi:hypothetical protein
MHEDCMKTAEANSVSSGVPAGDARDSKCAKKFVRRFAPIGRKPAPAHAAAQDEREFRDLS